jgi:hypothetical protein
MKMAKFELTVEAFGRGTIKVDEVDLTNSTKAIALFAAAGEPTILQVHTFGGGQVKGEGIVEIHTGTQGVGDWLKKIDRRKLEERSLAKAGWGSSGTLVDHLVDTLLEMVNETEPDADSQPG